MPKPRPVSKATLDVLTEQLAELIRLHGPKYALAGFSKATLEAVLIWQNGQKQKRPRGRPKADEKQRSRSEMRDFIAWFRIEEYLAKHPRHSVHTAADWLTRDTYPGEKKQARNTLRMRHARIVALHKKDPARAKKDHQFLKEQFGIAPLDT